MKTPATRQVFFLLASVKWINDRLAQQLDGCNQLSLITVIAKPVRRLVVAPKREARGSALGVQSASCDAEHRAALRAAGETDSHASVRTGSE